MSQVQGRGTTVSGWCNKYRVGHSSHSVAANALVWADHGCVPTH